MTKEIKLKCFSPDLLNPTRNNYLEKNQGGSKVIIIGKANTGKSTLIKYLIQSKCDLLPTGLVMSGTEDSNKFYASMFPDQFIYNEYNENAVLRLIDRQKKCLEHLEPEAQWALLLLDDCTENKRIFYTPTQESLFKNGRHWKLFYILSLQHAMDIPPSIRTNVDGIFIFREVNDNNLVNIWKNYAGVIPSLHLFKQVMNQVTGDYTAIYINNMSQINSDWTENVYWCKAPLINDENLYKFGCREYRNFKK